MIIAGLGNPGKEYEKTRHNLGFLAADAIAEKFRVNISEKKYEALTGILNFHGHTHLLMKPQTYMNLSGESLSTAMLDLKIEPENLLVLVDDISLPIGKIRLRPSGSDGGHNGLKSVIQHTGKKFWRLRIGVGAPENPDLEASETTKLNSNLINHVCIWSVNE